MDTAAMKLFSSNVKDWAKENLEYSGKMEYPILLVHMGSAMPIGLVSWIEIEIGNKRFLK